MSRAYTMHMARHILLVSSICICLSIHSQAQERSLIGVGIVTAYNHISNFETVAAGVTAELKIGDVLALNYRVHIGFGTHSPFFYVNTGITQALGAAINSAPLENIAAIAFIIPESYSFYIPLDEDMSIIPYVAPYGFEQKIFSKRSGKDNFYKVSSTLGCKFRARWFDFGDFVPHVGAKYIYNNNRKIGFVAGLDFIFNAR